VLSWVSFVLSVLTFNIVGCCIWGLAVLAFNEEKSGYLMPTMIFQVKIRFISMNHLGIHPISSGHRYHWRASLLVHGTG